MTSYKVLKTWGIDGASRKPGDIVTDEQIGDTVDTFITMGVIEALDAAVAAPPVQAAPEADPIPTVAKSEPSDVGNHEEDGA